MSRIGLQPVHVPADVKVEVDGDTISIKGPKGTLQRVLPPVVTVVVEKGELTVQRNSDDKFARSMHGTARSLVAGMVQGVKEEFVKKLEIQGVGFRAQVQGQKLTMSLGYSHPIEFVAPDGITITVADNTKLTVSGINKQTVGQVSAQIRSYYPAEPYKGKGVRYADEVVRRKAGKTVA